MADATILETLFTVFAPLSLTAFGGGIAVISAIQHQVVDVHRWMTGDQFLALFAISRAAPGPGSMLTTLIGFQVASVPGALVATVAMFVPSSILCVAVTAIWSRFRGRVFMVKLELAVAPIGAGLMLAGIVDLGRLFSASPSMLVLAAGSTALCFMRPQTHPMLLIALGALGGLAGSQIGF